MLFEKRTIKCQYLHGLKKRTPQVFQTVSETRGVSYVIFSWLR